MGSKGCVAESGLGVGPYANTGHRAIKRGLNVVPQSLALRALLAAIQAEVPNPQALQQ